jgi:hypothetical protein
MQDFVNKFDLSVLKTHSCQVNFDRLDEFNQKLLEVKLSDPVAAQQVLQDAKAGEGASGGAMYLLVKNANTSSNLISIGIFISRRDTIS